MSVSYDYTISADFQLGLDSEQLTLEITSSAISVGLEGINRTDDDVHIIFVSGISTAEETILDGIISAHTTGAIVDPDSLSVVIKEEDVPTGGRYVVDAYHYDITVTNGGIQTIDMTWNHDIAIAAVQIFMKDENIGDGLNLYNGPDTPIGGILSNVGSGDTVITVSPTVLQHAKIGYLCKIIDPVLAALSDPNSVNDLGSIIAIDKINSTITVTNAATSTFTPLAGLDGEGNPIYTAFMVTIHGIRNFHFAMGGIQVMLGSAKIGASYLPTGTVIRLTYQNNSANVKTLDFLIEMLE